MPNVRAQIGDAVDMVDAAYACADGSDALVLVTEWHEFRHLDLGRLAASMKGKALFDGRNIWDPNEARKAGFVYFGIGRP